MTRYTMLAAIAALSLATAALAQQAPGPGAAGAISDAVQGGASPYRPPGAATDPEQDKRDKCADIEEQLNLSPKQRKYTSPGTATQSAQGRAVPKIERDQTRKQLQQTYKSNCL